jgi:hypothetical protein
MIKKFDEFVNESKYEDLCDFGCNYISTYLKNNPNIDGKEFAEYVTDHNEAGRDSGELQDVCKSEIERLGKEFKKTKNINEGYKITPDDYSYFRGIIDEMLEGEHEENKKFWIDTFKNDRQRHINILLAFAKHDWVNGDGKPSEFPKEELTKIANEVLDEFIKEER